MSTRSATIQSTEPTASAGIWEDVRALLWLALPIIATKISHFAIGFTDFIYVSRLGTENTAAISPCTLLLFTILCLGMGTVSSVQTYSAQAIGRRTPHAASASARPSFYLPICFTYH